MQFFFAKYVKIQNLNWPIFTFNPVAPNMAENKLDRKKNKQSEKSTKSGRRMYSVQCTFTFVNSESYSVY